MNADAPVTLAKIPYQSTEILEYVVWEAEEGEFPEAVTEAAEEELERREYDDDMYPGDHGDTPSLQDQGLDWPSYAS